MLFSHHELPSEENSVEDLHERDRPTEKQIVQNFYRQRQEKIQKLDDQIILLPSMIRFNRKAE